jgi:hypothetical protein
VNGFGNIDSLGKKASDYVLEKPRDQKRINFAKKAEKNASRGE